MAIVMNMRWDGVTKTQYDQAREIVGWETDIPPGAKFHVASFDETGLRVTDVWESAEDFNRFVQQRLMPGVQQVGITGQPDVEITDARRIFAPNPRDDAPTAAKISTSQDTGRPSFAIKGGLFGSVLIRRASAASPIVLWSLEMPPIRRTNVLGRP